MKTILYIHGFNSTGNGTKSEAIKKTFSQYKVLTPTFNYKDFNSVVKQLHSLFVVNKIDVAVGTSLGGFLALYCASKYKVKCVAINPVTQPSETLKKMLGENRNYVSKERYIMTEADLAKYKTFEDNEFSKIELKDENTRFLLSEDDELLGDHHYLEQRFPQCHHFSYFAGQGHRFNVHKPIFVSITELLGE